MRIIKAVDGRISSQFHEPRPISNPGQHVHGAIDIAAKVGTVIIAPEEGEVFAWQSVRPEKGLSFPGMPVVHGRGFHFSNYFYDVYGTIIILVSKDKKRTHLIAHSYANQIFNKIFADIEKKYYEEKADKRFPLMAWYTEKKYINEGDIIGLVGNAGYSTGAHIHWEIHNGEYWNDYSDRINPEDLIR